MPNFEKAFRESNGQAIQYKDKTVILMDKIIVPTNFVLRVSIVSLNSEWKQGIAIKANKGKGTFISEHSNQKSNYFHIWQDAFEGNKELVYCAEIKNQTFSIWNIWDRGDGVTDAWVQGAGIIREVVSDNHIRYYCNDGHPDDNFNDIIFDIKISACNN